MPKRKEIKAWAMLDEDGRPKLSTIVYDEWRIQVNATLNELPKESWVPITIIID